MAKERHGCPSKDTEATTPRALFKNTILKSIFTRWKVNQNKDIQAGEGEEYEEECWADPLKCRGQPKEVTLM